mmetsp:Transcript_12893/g.23344  ORF Transcript_12893/g.23344 Transcript_12893/m.23344 type:complete len:140 (-) Transcript_12893:622-1041(-)
MNNKKEQWKKVTEALDTVQKPSELIEANGHLQDPRLLSFRAAALHDQTEGDQDMITMYMWHKDKVGNITMFYPLEGVSFNFIATPSMHTKPPANGKKEKAKLRETGAGFKKYQAYKANLSKTDHKKVIKFESDFLRKAT